jgi:hypothetical protein
MTKFHLEERSGARQQKIQSQCRFFFRLLLSRVRVFFSARKVKNTSKIFHEHRDGGTAQHSEMKGRKLQAAAPSSYCFDCCSCSHQHAADPIIAARCRWVVADYPQRDPLCSSDGPRELARNNHNHISDDHRQYHNRKSATYWSSSS